MDPHPFLQHRDRKAFVISEMTLVSSRNLSLNPEVTSRLGNGVVAQVVEVPVIGETATAFHCFGTPLVQEIHKSRALTP